VDVGEHLGRRLTLLDSGATEEGEGGGEEEEEKKKKYLLWRPAWC
jgi:hypothetical protein